METTHYLYVIICAASRSIFGKVEFNKENVPPKSNYSKNIFLFFRNTAFDNIATVLDLMIVNFSFRIDNTELFFFNEHSFYYLLHVIATW